MLNDLAEAIRRWTGKKTHIHIGLPARLPVDLTLVVAPTQRWSRVAGAVADDLHGKHPIEATPYLAGRSICAGGTTEEFS